MKVMYHGEEIEFKEELEKGEKELDFLDPEFEDTMELEEIVESINKEEAKDE